MRSRAINRLSLTFRSRSTLPLDRRRRCGSHLTQDGLFNIEVAGIVQGAVFGEAADTRLRALVLTTGTGHFEGDDHEIHPSYSRINIIDLLALTSGSAFAQQTTGTPGSPSATTTIDGKYLPPPPAPFGGTINMDAKDSKPYWPPTVVPPKGAPNVLLIMTDDQGYGVSGTFGGVIPTPSMDRIAKAGLRYTQFHSTALCSPSRRR